MKILLVDNHTKNSTQLKILLNDFNPSVCNKESFITSCADGYDFVILSGGSGVNSVKNHPQDYRNEIDFVTRTNKKIIGICLGCEIIAIAFGCSLRWVGKKKGFNVIKFGDQHMTVYESHQFVIDKVSPEIDVLATSKDGIEMIRHKNKPIYGLQFHPEMFPQKTQGKEIFFDLIKKI